MHENDVVINHDLVHMATTYLERVMVNPHIPGRPTRISRKRAWQFKHRVNRSLGCPNERWWSM